MSVTASVQRAHDALLELRPEGASHDGCPLCIPDAGNDRAKEVAHVTDTANVYTEDQHFALLQSAVQRGTAELSTVKEQLETQVASLTEAKTNAEAQLAEAQAKADVLEAEKATAEAEKAAIAKEFEDFKAELARKEEIETRKADRVSKVKAANANLADEYFTEARAQRWAEMADEAFEALVEDMTALTAAQKAETSSTDTDTKSAARETAAFTGGKEPAAREGSTFAAFMSATRGIPA